MFSFNNIKAQKYFADYMIIGNSLTYIRHKKIDSNQNKFIDDEYTWNTNIGIRITKRLVVGLQVLNIYSSQIPLPKKHYVVYGLFSQFNFLKSKEKRLFAEISFNRGNYCTCGNNIPYKMDNLYYLGLGVGYDYQIKKIPNLYLDFSIVFHNILNNMKRKYGYNIYIIGLNYRFHKNHKQS